MIKFNKQPNHISETKAYINKGSIDVFYHIIHEINNQKLIDKTPEEILYTGKELSIKIPKRVLVKSNNYTSLYKKIDALKKNKINYTYTDSKKVETIKDTVIIRDCDFNKNKQHVILYIPVSAQLYLLTTKQNFTHFNLDEVLTFKNYYSKLMYEFCHQYKNVENGILNYKIDHFRKRFNIQNSYLKKEIFKYKILEQPKKELKEKSSIFFDYRILKNKQTGELYLKFKISIDPNKSKISVLAKENYGRVYNFLAKIYGDSISIQRLTDQIYNNSLIGVARQRFDQLNNDLGYGKKTIQDITYILNKSILPEYEIDINMF